MASGGYSLVAMCKLLIKMTYVVGSKGSRHSGSVDVVHGLSCSEPCRIFPDKGPNLFPLHWHADSYSLYHQGSPFFFCSLIFGEVEYLWEEGAELQYFPLQDLCGTQEAGYRKSQYEMEFK